MLSAHRDNLTLSFLIRVPLISFPCLMAVDKTFRTILSSHGESGLPCLVHDLNGNAPNFSIQYDTNVGLFQQLLIATNKNCREKKMNHRFCSNMLMNMNE